MQQSAMCDTAPAHGCEMVRDKFASDCRRSERARVFQLEKGSKWGFPRRRGAGSRARTAAISHFAVVPVFEFKHQSAARNTGRACPLGAGARETEVKLQLRRINKRKGGDFVDIAGCDFPMSVP